MLIQNANNLNQASTPTRLASDGGPVSVGSTPNVQVKPAAVPDLPHTAVNPMAEQQPSPAQVKNAVDNLNKALQQSNKNLEFTVDAETDDRVVKLVDSETGDVIRQYPSKEALSIAKAIDDYQRGLLIKQQA